MINIHNHNHADVTNTWLPSLTNLNIGPPAGGPGDTEGPEGPGNPNCTRKRGGKHSVQQFQSGNRKITTDKESLDDMRLAMLVYNNTFDGFMNHALQNGEHLKIEEWKPDKIEYNMQGLSYRAISCLLAKWVDDDDTRKLIGLHQKCRVIAPKWYYKQLYEETIPPECLELQPFPAFNDTPIQRCLCEELSLDCQNELKKLRSDALQDLLQKPPPLWRGEELVKNMLDNPDDKLFNTYQNYVKIF